LPKPTFFNLPEDKRNALIELAIDAFAEKDYNQVSISRWVALAGIAKGSFYQYFEDKQDLYFYLLDLASKEKLSLLQGQTPPDPSMDLFAYLHWMLAANLHFQLAHPRLAQVGYRALYSGDLPFRSELLQKMKKSADDYYRQLVQLGIRQGAIDPGIDPDLAVFVLGSSLNEFGNYLIEKLGFDPQKLTGGDLTAGQQQAMLELVNGLIRILRSGLGSHAAIESDGGR
jgi:TetR/AcrR family transcriptional regulator